MEVNSLLQKSNRLVEICYLVKRLRYKFAKEDGAKKDQHQKILNNIVWFSLPLFYDYDSFDKNSDLCKIHRAIENRRKKKHRINKYLRDMRECYEQLYFVSLTFTDDVLSNISDTTRHRYAREWCSKYCRDYFCNEDFGKQNGRPHYHAVVALNNDLEKKVLFDAWIRQNDAKNGIKTRDEMLRYGWKYGYSSIKPIVTRFENDDDATRDNYRMSGYMLKLSNHAGKFGTGKSFHKRGARDIDILPF